MTPFLQTSNQQSTLENWKFILEKNQLPSFGLFAYVTDSGVAQIMTHLHDYLNNARTCRWVFGFDYGRSQPTAVKRLAQVDNTEIRIYDGEYVVQSARFIPRKSFHLKTALTHKETGQPCKQIVGSGNLSASGLTSGIEAGCVIDYTAIDEAIGINLMFSLEELWENATPFEKIIGPYEQLYEEVCQPKVVVEDKVATESTLFWIDVGYVTKNRGANKPGNQFDLPRGSHAYLGLKENPSPKLNSVLGELRIRTISGEVVDRPLRFGNNSMEKLTLPIPEQFGYDCYDGKILTFKLDQSEVILEALEHDAFMRIYGLHIAESNRMQSGRPYGTVKLG